MIDKVIYNKQDLFFLYQSLIPHWPKKLLLLLQGPVGVGKTESLKMWGQLLGWQSVASPSFAIHHQYRHSGQWPIHHVDLYRIEDQSDLESTGFWDLFSDSEGWIIVEWPERVPQEQWPLDWPQLKIHLSFVNDGSEFRRIQIFSELG